MASCPVAPPPRGASPYVPESRVRVEADPLPSQPSTFGLPIRHVSEGGLQAAAWIRPFARSAVREGAFPSKIQDHPATFPPQDG